MDPSDLPIVSGWSYPIGLIAVGAALAYGGYLLLGEYRRVFVDDPRAVMSVEVWLQVLFHPAPTPGNLGVIALFLGLWLLIAGAGLLLLLCGFYLDEVIHRLWFPRIVNPNG